MKRTERPMDAEHLAVEIAKRAAHLSQQHSVDFITLNRAFLAAAAGWQAGVVNSQLQSPMSVASFDALVSNYRATLLENFQTYCPHLLPDELAAPRGTIN